MTTPGPRAVSYLCPRCHAALTAKAEDAGQKQACPHCGKVVKVPGTHRPSSSPASASAPPKTAGPSPQPPVEGIANVGLRCPVCGTRMYATREQIGKSMVCPDCLETIAVPPTSTGASSTSASRPARQAPASPPIDSAQGPAVSSAPGPAVPQESDDDLKLSAPIEIPAERFLPQRLADLLDEAAGPPAQISDNEASIPPTDSPMGQGPAGQGPADRGTLHDEYAIKCPVCDTLLYATEDEIGQRMTCPDCYSQVEITRPRPKPRRVNEVIDANFEGQLFSLSEPVPRDIYHGTESGQDPKTFGEQALRDAERELDRKTEDSFELPASPLWTGLFQFLADAAVLMRFLVSAALLGGITKLSMATVAWSTAGGAEWFLALIGTTALVALTVLSVIVIGGTCLTILQDTANGQDKVTQWPTGGPVEMVGDVLAFAFALFYSILPGLVVFGITGSLGMPLTTRWIFLGISVYLFFPVVQMSILEADSLTTPLSRPIVTALRDEFLLWFTFYLTTFAIALLLAITLASLRPHFSTAVLMLFGAVWALALFLYFRLLGRLAWACQVRPLEKAGSSAEEKD
ncbi:MAG: DUF4013 domain-containing protein [Pirellulaceae bacterium]